MAFATKAELDTYLGTTTTQARADLMLALATAAIQRYCGQSFALVENDSITLRGTWGDTFLLPERPVQNVDSITVDGMLAPALTYTWASDGEVKLLSDPRFVINLAERDGGYWGGDRVLVVIVYDHGDDIPDDVKGACLAIASRLYTTAATGGVSQESLGAYSVTYSHSTGPALTDDEKAALKPFRRTAGTVVPSP